MTADPTMILMPVLAQETGTAPAIAGRDTPAAAPGETTTQPGTQQTPGANPQTGASSGVPSMLPLLAIMFGFLILMMFMSGRAQKKEQRKRQEMLDSLRRQDRVLTRGGLIGTVAEFRNSKQEVVLKVDEQAGVKLTFAREAVQQVLTEPEDRAEPELEDEEETFGAPEEAEPARV
ncbi:MAG: preprotein translocase subunit YajC [Planctomycetota bacterium]